MAPPNLLASSEILTNIDSISQSFYWLLLLLRTMLLFSTVKVFPEWNHFSEPWNVFFWVSHLHLKWTFVARACEGLQGSTRGANGSRIKNILGKEKWFQEETFYKLRMGLCSMITGITNFLIVFSCWKNDFSLYLVTAWKKNHLAWKKNHLAWKKNHFSFISDRKIIFLSLVIEKSFFFHAVAK